MKIDTIKDIEEAEKEMIKQLIQFELAKSRLEHEEMFNSMHEAESVIREELEEAEEELEAARDRFEYLHTDLRVNGNEETFKTHAGAMQRAVIRCIAECIQLGAMCEKKWRTKKNE